MNWLERNVRVLSEIQTSIRLKKGELVGRSFSGTTFTTLGSYHSSTLGLELHLGLKNYERDVHEVRTMDDLAFIRVVAERLPHLEPELPVVFGLLRDRRSGADLGILMEDFSQGSRLQVVEVAGQDLYYARALPREIVTLVGEFPDQDDEDYELGKICFMVGNDESTESRRLGDFNTILTCMPFKKRYEEVFPLDDIFDNFDLYTMTIDYDL